MRLDTLPIGAFDVVLLIVLALGLMRGRKLGMSEELMNVLEWVCALAAATFAYQPLGEQLEKASPFGLLTSYVVVYIAIVLITVGLFALLKRSIGGKLLGSDLFGKSEYYLGMASGMIRFGCILIMGLALLNARYFSAKEVQELERYQNDVYGSNFFPGLQTVQATVFEKSLAGAWIKENLGRLLIKPTAPGGKEIHQREYAMPG